MQDCVLSTQIDYISCFGVQIRPKIEDENWSKKFLILIGPSSGRDGKKRAASAAPRAVRKSSAEAIRKWLEADTWT
jgi:hypothetical protein